jgi:hypothetical protein
MLVLAPDNYGNSGGHYFHAAVDSDADQDGASLCAGDCDDTRHAPLVDPGLRLRDTRHMYRGRRPGRLMAQDLPNPPLGETFFYSVRASNGCGSGVLGFASDGSQRPGRTCP